MKNPSKLGSRMTRLGASPPNLENAFFEPSTKFALESHTNSFTNEHKQMASVIWLTVGRTHNMTPRKSSCWKTSKTAPPLMGNSLGLWFKTTTLMKCPLTELNWPALNKKWPVLNSSKATRLEISMENLNPRARLQRMPPTRQRQWKKLWRRSNL